jgi:hypothetical protein
MANYRYPQTDYDRAQNMLALLGSFWAEFYHGRDQISSVVAAKGQVENQTINDLMEAANALARESCPVFHTDNWYMLRLLASEKNTGVTSLLTYDTAGALFDSTYQYGVPPETRTYSFPAPADLHDVRQIYNRFTEPSLCLTNGVDFVLRNGAVIFAQDPFTDPRVAKRAVYLNGEVVDEEAAVWLFRGSFDYETLYRQYGYVLGMKFRSGLAYRDMLNAFFDALVGGTSSQQLLMAAAAITGIPLVIEPTETVTDIVSDYRGVAVVTDQHVYRFSDTTVPTVSVGDVVHAGDTVSDALQVVELNRGEIPDDLHALAMGRGFLANCYYADLIFENKEVPLEVDTNHPSGFTYVSFGLGGFPLDVSRFFDDMHERGIAASQLPVDDCEPGQTVLIPGDECDGIGTPDQRIRRGTLAHLLDVRENPIGEPTAASLPATINPLQFLVQNVLRANAVLIRVKASGLQANGLGLHASTYLRQIVPPHTAVILCVDLTPAQERITEDMFDEGLSTFQAMGPIDDQITEDMFRELVSVKTVSGTCQ